MEIRVATMQLNKYDNTVTVDDTLLEKLNIFENDREIRLILTGDKVRLYKRSSHIPEELEIKDKTEVQVYYQKKARGKTSSIGLKKDWRTQLGMTPEARETVLILKEDYIEIKKKVF